MLKEAGPLLIAANHPNSFLDAIIVASLFKCPVYSLARGDAFTNKFISKILHSFNMLPVYRVSEGSENLEQNYTTFEACQKLFEQNKVVLIFSEGRCINEWHLRPLKKGTARLAFKAWERNIPLKVLPVGINYSSFRFYGKNVFLNFGSIMSLKDFHHDFSQGRSMNQFNEKLHQQLSNLVFEVDKNDHGKLNDYFYIKQPLVKKILLFLPAIIGFICHAPLYLFTHLIIKKIAKDHYDSVFTSILFLFYPIIVMVIILIVFLSTKSLYSLLLLILLPFTLWSYLQLKKQIR